MRKQRRIQYKRLFIVLILLVITFGVSSFQSDNPEHTVFGLQTEVGSITIVNTTIPTGGTGFFYFGSLGSFTLDDGQSHQATGVIPGNYDVYQDVPAGWQLDISCDGNSTPLAADAVTIHLGAGEDIICTFTNTDVAGSITIVNTTNPAGATGFSFWGDIGGFTLDDGQSYQEVNLMPGDYNIFETVPFSWQLNVSCTGGDFTPLGIEAVTVHLDAGEDIICTFANTNVGGSITIVNETIPTGGTDFFYFGDLGSFTLDDTQSNQINDMMPGDYVVIQDVPVGWIVDISCVGGGFTVVDNSVTIHLGANEDVVCTFSNTYVGGSVTIVNTTDPAGATGFFYFGAFGDHTLDDGQSFTEADIMPGDYTIFQDVPAGWIVDISCTGGDFTPVDNSVTIHLDANEDVVCTFSNTDIGGSITIVNATDPAGGTGFFYFGSLGSFTLDDDQSYQATGVIPGNYDIYQDIPAGWQLDISCADGSSTPLGTGAVTIHLGSGENIVCTFTNTDVAGSITIVNAANPAGATGFDFWGNIGSFTLDDGQSFTEADIMPGDYTIFQDVPAGWIVDISCTGGDFTAVDNSVTIHLDANEDIVCTFSNTDVGGSITIINATDPAGGTGFFYFGNLGEFTLDDGQNYPEPTLLPGDYTVFQEVPVGWTLNIACVGGTTDVVDNSVTIHLNTNEDIVCTFTNTDDSIGNEPPVIVFFDDFESDLGWTSNPNSTDTATTGQWERGNPSSTYYYGTKQRGTTISGYNNLVTQASAGRSVGSYDIDNGETSVRSPNIILPAKDNITLSFYYYMAHTSNSSDDDYLRVKVVGATTGTVLEELGADNDDDAVWESFSADLSAFAGQTVYLLIEAADAANGSIVEAAIDDVMIVASDTALTSVFFDDFEADQGWTSNPNSTDTATTGQWERGNPSSTSYYGPKQSGTTVSGYNNLVTGASSGWSVGSYDVDNGETSVRSSEIVLPDSNYISLSFYYYMAHTSNSSTDDYFRVKVVGETTEVVLEELGAEDDDDAIWQGFTVDLTSFAGQTVYLLIEASDAANGSIVEAAVDDVSIVALP